MEKNILEQGIGGSEDRGLDTLGGFSRGEKVYLEHTETEVYIVEKLYTGADGKNYATVSAEHDPDKRESLPLEMLEKREETA